MKRLTLDYLIREPKSNTKTPSLLILLHGYGSNEEDLFSFANELPDDLLIVSLRAPYEMGYGGYAWYAINLDDQNNKWFGTRNGVFVQSPDGEEQLAHFTESNSPLFDNQIHRSRPGKSGSKGR